jgi:hypothetical protein
MNELEQAKEIFLTDVDDETANENAQKLREWESRIQTNQSYLTWKEHPITQEINRMVREAYKDHGLALAENRTLDEDQRANLFAKQDACRFILSLTSRDAKTDLEQTLRDIRYALSATN